MQQVYYIVTPRIKFGSALLLRSSGGSKDHQAEPHNHIGKKKLGRARTTASTVESRNMAAILQIIGWQLTVYFSDIGQLCYDQLTPVKTRCLLTSITWPCRALKSTSHWGQVFFWSWPPTECCFLIGFWAHVWLTCWKQGRIAQKPANANPGLKFTGTITFSSIQMFFAALFCVYKTQNRNLALKVSKFYLYLG